MFTFLLGAAVIAQTVSPPKTEGEFLVDKVAAKTVAKFQNTSCADLASSLHHGDSNPKKEEITAKFTAALKANPSLKNRYFQQVSTPILSKMFDCGMLPK